VHLGQDYVFFFRLNGEKPKLIVLLYGIDGKYLSYLFIPKMTSGVSRQGHETNICSERPIDKNDVVLRRACDGFAE